MTNNRKKSHLSLSKSLFIRGLQCHKSLYLDRYHPELKDEVSESQERLFQGGSEVGVLARDLFPGGIEIAYEGHTFDEQVRLTAREIEKGTTILYEATFVYDDVFMKADIIRKGIHGWELYEVKATTEVKDVHLDDVALQYYVMTGAGLEVNRTFLVHLDNQYVRQGDLELDKLFLAEEITEAVVSRQPFIKEKIGEMRSMLRGDTPEIDIGEYCEDPYPCDFQGHCWQHMPENSVFELRQRGAKPFDLYRQGILYLKDIPLELVSNRQLMQLEGFLGRKEFVDRERIKAFLDSLWYPVYFLDFETFQFAIPPFDGLRPYQQLPFQYSLHFLEDEGAELQHIEYLAEPNIDPRHGLAEKLLNEIPVTACVLAYNSSFEAGRLRELAAFLPQYREKIELILENIRDLAVPFRSQAVYHWLMKGSYSQKAVLPVLVPELSYEGMEVGHGGEAMDAYAAMNASEDAAEVADIRKALLEYCKLDTLGMVRILEKLRGMA